MKFRRVSLIMAGGSGTRFWPASTHETPKQFLRLASVDKTLMEQSLARAQSLTVDDVYVSTSRALVGKTTAALGGPSVDHVFDEPSARNTLGALVWSSAHLKATIGEDWERVSVAVLTADHMINPLDGFLSTASKALTTAEGTGGLVTIGIKPTRAATEYGYIQRGERHSEGVSRAVRFTEKPDAKTAEGLVSSGGYLWNSGMFFWTLKSFRDNLAKASPTAFSILREIEGSLARRDRDAATRAFETLESISIDYALMEKSSDVFVVEAEFDWDDLGSWDALARSLPHDERGNVTQGSARFIDSDSCVTYSHDQGTRISLLGVDNLVVVVTKNEVLVCDKDRAQDVRKLAD